MLTSHSRFENMSLQSKFRGSSYFIYGSVFVFTTLLIVLGTVSLVPFSSLFASSSPSESSSSRRASAVNFDHHVLGDSQQPTSSATAAGAKPFRSHQQRPPRLPVPVDVRTLSTLTKVGGFNSSVSTTRSWIVVKRADALLWWERHFGGVIGFSDPRSPRPPLWSCTIGRARPMPSPAEIEQFGWTEPRGIFNWKAARPMKNLSLYVGPGWGGILPHGVEEKMLAGPRSLLRMIGSDIPEVYSFGTLENATMPCTKVKVAPPPTRQGTSSSGGGGAGTNSSSKTSSTGRERGSNGVWYQKDFTAKMLGLLSLGDKALAHHCAESILLLDGRSPSFGHAMSRRCKYVPELQHRNLFIAGIGHSHTRYLFTALCHLSNHSFCSDFQKFQFSVPLYPIRASNFFVNQGVPLPQMASDTAAAAAAAFGDDVEQRRAEEKATQERILKMRREQKIQYLLLYGASWYNPQMALMYMMQTWIPREVRDTLEGDNITAPNIHEFHDESLGYDDSKNRSLMEQWDREIKSWVGRTRKHFAVVPTHLVISKGEWELHFLSPKLSAITEQLSNFMLLVHELLPSTVIILQLPQRHFHIVSRQVPRDVQEWRHQCGNELRVQAMREANLCAGISAINKAASLKRKIILLDSDTITRSHAGQSFVDIAGHHYLDIVLELIALEVRHIMSSHTVQEHYVNKTVAVLERRGRRGECNKLMPDAGCFAPASFLKKLNSRIHKEGSMYESVAAAAERKAAVAAGTEDEQCLSYSQLAGFPPPRGSVFEQCTCHRDVFQNATIRKYCDNHPRIPPKNFDLFQQVLKKSQEYRKALRSEAKDLKNFADGKEG